MAKSDGPFQEVIFLKQSEAVLLLEDGTIFRGRAFGAIGDSVGELIFNTSMSGYQEVITDPSYNEQIVVMTYPLIGNYGICGGDNESSSIQVSGLAVRECCRYPSNWRCSETLDEFFIRHQVPGIEEIDTRAIVRHIRHAGEMKSIISTGDTDYESLMTKLVSAPSIIGRDLVENTTCKEPYRPNLEEIPPMGKDILAKLPVISNASRKPRIAVYDCGIKNNMVRILMHLGCEVILFPAISKSEDIMKCDPDGLFLSNGPGDPEGVPYLKEEVKELMRRIPEMPIFGICFGHQIMALALGASTYKLKFGHRGGNQPVKDVRSGKIIITSQNHGFCVDIRNVEEEVEPLFINLNDGTLEGLRHREHPWYSVQFHPEASPGPHDAAYLFGEFIESVSKFMVKK